MTNDQQPELDLQPSTGPLAGIDIYQQDALDNDRPKQVAALLKRWKDHVKTIMSINAHDLNAE